MRDVDTNQIQAILRDYWRMETELTVMEVGVQGTQRVCADCPVRPVSMQGVGQA